MCDDDIVAGEIDLLDVGVQLGGVLVLIFWAVIAIGIVARVAVALVRRRPKRVTSEVLAPIVTSVAVQSELFGWKPYDPTSLHFDEDSRSGADATASEPEARQG